PIIERVARAMGPLPIRRSGETGSSFMASLVLYTPTSHFSGTAGTDFEQRHGDYAEIRWMGGQNTPPSEALKIARVGKFGSVDAAICIAGVGAPEDWKFPDVDEELHLALTRQRPTFCIGGFGGFVRDWFDHDPPGRSRFLNNGLGEENVTLATSQSPADLLRL